MDEQLPPNGFGLPTIERLVALAAARFAPEEQAERSGLPSLHHVTLTLAGTSRHVPAAGDEDLTAFYALVCAEAKRSAGSVTPTTTRPARPRPSGSSPPQGTLDLTAKPRTASG